MLKLKIEVRVQGNNRKNTIKQRMINYQPNCIEFITIEIQGRGRIIVREVFGEHIVKQMRRIWRGRAK